MLATPALQPRALAKCATASGRASRTAICGLLSSAPRSCVLVCARSAAELAQAHANRLRQTLDGEHFGDVIASIANGSGNPVILRRQIDGSCELRLSAIAAMIDDEVLCHAFGDGKTMVLFDQSQRKIDAGRDAS